MHEHKSSVSALAISSDERYMVSGAADGEIIVWLCHNWVKLCVLDHDETLIDVEELFISKDNIQLMAIDSCGVAAHWQFKSDDIEKDARELKIPQDEIKSAIISPDLRYLAAITQNGIKIWDMDQDEIHDLSREFENLTHKGVKFAYDSKHLYFCSEKNKLVKYNFHSNSVTCTFTTPKDCRPITCFALESSDKYIFVVTSSCEIIAYDT